MGDNKLAKSCVLREVKKIEKKLFVSENCKATIEMIIVIITNLHWDLKLPKVPYHWKMDTVIGYEAHTDLIT